MKIRNPSLGLRIWHWLDALVVISLIITFFLRDWMVSNSRFLVAQLASNQVPVTNESARPIIHELVDRLWVWHIYLGYALTALFVLRLVLFYTDKKNPILQCWEGICELRTHFDFRNVHSALVKTGYVIFYALQIFMIVSGFMLTFGKDWGLSRDFSHQVHELHEAIMWFFLFFVVAHIFGVFAAENLGDPGIVSNMINGGRNSKNTPPAE